MKLLTKTLIFTYLFTKDGVDYQATTSVVNDYGYGGNVQMITVVIRMADKADVDDKELVEYAEDILMKIL